MLLRLDWSNAVDGQIGGALIIQVYTWICQYWAKLLAIAVAVPALLPAHGYCAAVGEHRLAPRAVAVSPTSVVTAAASQLEQLLLQDAVDGHWDLLTLWEAAFIADAPQDPKSIGLCEAGLSQLAAQLKGYAPRAKVEEATHHRARAIFDFLHERILTGSYRVDCTLYQTLEHGDYNCLTATLLYCCLCQLDGVPCQAIAAPGHVYCRILEPSAIDVEMTVEDWNSATSRDLTPGKPEEQRRLTEVQLVAKVYYNRGSKLLEQQSFAEAIDALAKAWDLDQSHSAARTNLLAALNNWALLACDAGDYERAAELVAHGLTIAPDYAPLLSNDLYVHHHWVLSLCKQQRYEDALDILRRAEQRRPDESFELSRTVVHRARDTQQQRSPEP